MGEKEALLTKSKVLELGFTEKLINELLPESVLKQNPIFKSASPMKLWREEDVQKALETDQFKEYQLKSAKKREGAKKAV